MASYSDFFQTATGHDSIFPYQQRLAENQWPDLLNIPTGLGKTAAVTLAWAWRRGLRPYGKREATDDTTPRRLVWCFPMRVLVEQTVENIKEWFSRLGWLGEAGEGKVSIHVLMGGEDDLKSWTQWPEEEMILVGTQDMLLSRALMRGYGISRYQWPIHFSLLHNDSLWVFDEVQLMGSGLATAAQIEAFRRNFSLAKPSRTLWVSATLSPAWLATVDFKPHIDTLNSLCINEEDRNMPAVQTRLSSLKRLAPEQLPLTKENAKQKGKDYINSLSEKVMGAKKAGKNTLVVLNRVDRAQGLYKKLKKQNLPDDSLLLLHARFRPAERRAIESRLKTLPPNEGRIIIATQAVEAGVDITSATLFTELAPWPSLVQRFGRCNRYGEENASGGGEVFWVDIQDDEQSAPYDPEELDSARRIVQNLDTAASGSLPPVDEKNELQMVIRKKDFIELFNTDPDISGFDIDISEYVRDPGQPRFSVFWREMDDPNDPLQPLPGRDELCPVSIGQANTLKNRTKWFWDTLARKWVKLAGFIRPGMTLMLDAKEGGYHPEYGFSGDEKGPVKVIDCANSNEDTCFDSDKNSLQIKPVTIPDHLNQTVEEAQTLCSALNEKHWLKTIMTAAKWHDVGKSHPVFQETMHSCDQVPAGLLAKSPCNAFHNRRYFRHELASMLAWIQNPTDSSPEDINVVAFLLAAHHGKVRMSIRALPDEPEAPEGKRYARGIWENDKLPGFSMNGNEFPPTALKLDLMELGESPPGPSWTARTQELLADHGPFVLSWLESLVRIADWRASANPETTASGEE
ncbi:MAG: CRISPR-associated helicase Cas3' [Desulfobacteraceae bacterium]|nr:CRISPR-associated helicase Cas3' [Desulfobacteraceae bacterium]